MPPPGVHPQPGQAAPVLWTHKADHRAAARGDLSTSAAPMPAPGPAGSPTPTPPRRRWPRVVGLGNRDRGHRGRRLLHRADRRPLMDKLLAGVAHGARMHGGLVGDAPPTPSATTDNVPKQVALHHHDNWTAGGMGQRRGHVLAPSLATTLCYYHRRGRRAGQRGRCASRRRGHVRPARHRRQLLQLTTPCCRASSGVSETPAQADLDEAVLRPATTQRPAAGRRRRRHQTRHRTVTGAATEDDALVAARQDRPRQPGQDRAVRVRPGTDGCSPPSMALITLDPDRVSVSFNGAAVCASVSAPRCARWDLSDDIVRRLRQWRRQARIRPLIRRTPTKRTRPTAHEPHRSTAHPISCRCWPSLCLAQAVARQGRRRQHGGNAMTDDKARVRRRHGVSAQPRHPSRRGARRGPQITAMLRRPRHRGRLQGRIPGHTRKCSGWCCSVRWAGNWST